MANKPTQDELHYLAHEWAEFLFEEYTSSKQLLLDSDTIKEMLTPTYHEESK